MKKFSKRFTRQNFSKKHLGGFTLIEMLIVVTIIAVLASLILVGMGGARSKSRDARRVADLHNVMNALELYYAKKGQYPEGVYASATNWETFKSILKNGGIGVTRVPNDPLNDSTYYYRYGGTTTDYVLGAALETEDRVLDEDVDGTNIYGIDCGSGGSSTDEVYCIRP